MALMFVGLLPASQADAKAPRCTKKYTTCVLACNGKSVRLSRAAQSAITPNAQATWNKLLVQNQRTCIPQCYQVHCLGKRPKTLARK